MSIVLFLSGVPVFMPFAMGIRLGRGQLVVGVRYSPKELANINLTDFAY